MVSVRLSQECQRWTIDASEKYNFSFFYGTGFLEIFLDILIFEKEWGS